MTPADLLDSIDDGRDPAAVVDALQQAIRLVGTGRAANLEDGLGLRPGQLRAWCRQQRDRWLVEAARLVAPGAPPGTQAVLLLRRIRSTEHVRARARRLGRWPDDQADRALAIAESYAPLLGRRQLIMVLDAARADATASRAA